MSQPKKMFKVDPDALRLFQEGVEIGKIVELSADEAGALRDHIPDHQETLWCANSGVEIGNDYGVFAEGQNLIAVEWVRHETNPKPNEPECNLYRYVFGLAKDGKSCIGMDVTTKYSNAKTQQVGNHHDGFDEMWDRHFGERQ